MEKEINRWYKKLWETKGSRFIAANRFDRIDRYSNITIHLISAYLLCVNLLVLLPKRPDILSNDNISFFSICASIILLVISLHVPSRKYGDISHKFHSCGRDINILYDKVCYWKNNPETVDQDQIKELIDEYNLILKNYDINHSTLDFSIFKCSNYKDYYEKFPTWFYFKTYVIYFFSYYLLYFVAIIFPLVIFYILMN